MNPVLICLLLTAQMMVMGKPVSESKERPATAIHKDDSFGSQLRHRSLPQSSLTAAGNFAGNHGSVVNNKNGGVSLSELGVELILGFLADRSGTSQPKSTITTTTETSTVDMKSYKASTVDIKTLTGYWLKDSSQILEPTGAPSDVDYRTERYHLDDLLKKQ